jgi:hypothetical protein
MKRVSDTTISSNTKNKNKKSKKKKRRRRRRRKQNPGATIRLRYPFWQTKRTKKIQSNSFSFISLYFHSNQTNSKATSFLKISHL